MNTMRTTPAGATTEDACRSRLPMRGRGESRRLRRCLSDLVSDAQHLPDAMRGILQGPGWFSALQKPRTSHETASSFSMLASRGPPLLSVAAG